MKPVTISFGWREGDRIIERYLRPVHYRRRAREIKRLLIIAIALVTDHRNPHDLGLVSPEPGRRGRGSGEGRDRPGSAGGDRISATAGASRPGPAARGAVSSALARFGGDDGDD